MIELLIAVVILAIVCWVIVSFVPRPAKWIALVAVGVIFFVWALRTLGYS